MQFRMVWAAKKNAPEAKYMIEDGYRVSGETGKLKD